MATVTTSKQFRLSVPDWLKGLLMAIGAPVIAIIIDSANQGTLSFNWKLIATTAISAGGMYLLKNFFTPTTTTISGTTESTIVPPTVKPK